MRLRIAFVAVAGMLAVSVPGAGAAQTGRLPLGVHTAVLSQAGQQLIWSVQLDHPFSPSALRHDHRSLCLLIERSASGSVAGQLCVATPARGQREPSLIYSAITRSWCRARSCRPRHCQPCRCEVAERALPSLGRRNRLPPDPLASDQHTGCTGMRAPGGE